MKKIIVIIGMIALLATTLVSGIACSAPRAIGNTPTSAPTAGAVNTPPPAMATSTATTSVVADTPTPAPAATPGAGNTPLPIASTSTPTNPVIQIVYLPTFAMQDGVGYVLFLNMAIHNNGYDSFDTSPERFSVAVSNREYRYDASLSDLQATSVPNGGKALGKLAFVVPSSASSPKVGFTVGYSGTRLYNIQWFQTDGAPLPTPSVSTPTSPFIQIAYSPTFTMQAGVGYVLVLNVAIHNYGYDSFDTSPERFSVVVSNRDYRYNASLSDLKSVSVPNGGKALGKLAFVVPSGASSPKVGFTVGYSGTQAYNIRWVQVD